MKKKPLGESKRKLLRALAQHGVMTPRQACVTCFAPSSYTRATEQLDELEKAGMVWRKRMEVRTRNEGAFPYIYGLEEPGVKVVRPLVDYRLRVLSEDEREQKQGNLHDLTINDVFVQAKLATYAWPDLELLETIHGRVLRQKMAGQAAVPDGYLLFRRRQRYDAIFLEVDESGKENERVWKQKIRGLVDLLGDEQIRTNYIIGGALEMIAVVVVDGDSRLERLRRWTAEAAPEYNGYFAFTSVLPTMLGGLDYFTQSHWIYPGKDLYLPLLR